MAWGVFSSDDHGTPCPCSVCWGPQGLVQGDSRGLAYLQVPGGRGACGRWPHGVRCWLSSPEKQARATGPVGAGRECGATLAAGSLGLGGLACPCLSFSRCGRSRNAPTCGPSHAWSLAPPCPSAASVYCVPSECWTLSAWRAECSRDQGPGARQWPEVRAGWLSESVSLRGGRVGAGQGWWGEPGCGLPGSGVQAAAVWAEAALLLGRAWRSSEAELTWYRGFGGVPWRRLQGGLLALSGTARSPCPSWSLGSTAGAQPACRCHSYRPFPTPPTQKPPGGGAGWLSAGCLASGSLKVS